MRPADAGAALRAGRQARRTVAPFTDADPTLDEPWGYDVQALDRAQRSASGESVVGAKLGLTSAAKQQRMGVHKPIVGFLTETMRVETDSLAQAATNSARPRIEPEIAFLTARPLSAPLTLAETARAVDGVTVAAGIIDSRYDGYRFRLPDVVADNTSAAGFLVGPITRPAGSPTLYPSSMAAGTRSAWTRSGRCRPSREAAARSPHRSASASSVSDATSRSGAVK